MKIAGRSSARTIASPPKCALPLRQVLACLFAIALGPATLPSAFAADTTWGEAAPRKLVWKPARPERSDSATSAATTTKSADDAAVRNAIYDQDVFDDVPAPPKRIRLATGSSSDATSDPFGDNQQSIQSRKKSATLTQAEPELIDSLPPPMREAPPALQIDSTPAKKDPVELTTPPDPLRSGALKRMLPTNQTEPFIPSVVPTPEEQLGQQPQRTPQETCKIEYDRIKAITLNKLSTDIGVTGNVGNDIPFECSLSTDPFQPRCWRLTTYTWKASALCHKPLYFEDEALERYGHSHGPVCEYGASWAHFFGDVALLPYHIGIETPCECIYDLGVYRVGDCTPYMLNPFPFSLRGAATAGLGYCGVIALFP